ncbi:spermidine/putrescine ABC transporter substrate-binding protein [Planktothrix agardhii 1033]|nr:spermidine/putrescine ABC transporter substrate-binding protein [Planktothrix agardhii 1033]
MKRILTLILLFCLGVFLPFGCTANQSSTPPTAPTANVLNIYNWSTYIDPEVLKAFEQKYQVKVNYDTYDSAESLYAKLKAGNPGYDVAFPPDYMVKIMVKEQMLEELDPANIANIKNIEPKFLNPPYDPGNKYSIPYQWITLGIGYNPEQIKKAQDFLIKNKDNIAAFAPDTGQQLLNQGEVNLTMEYSGDIFQVMAENPDLRYVIPKEGSIIGMDNMVIPKGAPNKKLAETFINFILEPENSAKISNFIDYASPNKVAIDQKLIDAENLKNPGIYPPPEIFDKLQYLQDLGEATQLYDQAWTEIKAGVGNG